MMSNPSIAVQAHRNSSDFSVYGMASQRYINGEEKTLTLKDLTPVPTNRFAEDERTVFIFQDIAGNYGFHLRDNGINAMPFAFDSEDYIDGQKGPYANQLWLAWLGDGSRVSGYGRFLSYNGRVRGV
ncbi:hypothetical protein J4468_04480, partial [Candidatus Woesearchaeota archaeon]|nr:hypothetical protein [Candidatus Woesearchaeota archaeon]